MTNQPLWSLPTEQQTKTQHLIVCFDESDKEQIKFIAGDNSFSAHAFVVDDHSVIEYTHCDSPILSSTTQILVPNISISTLCALIESSYSNTFRSGADANEFSLRFKVRLERLTKK